MVQDSSFLKDPYKNIFLSFVPELSDEPPIDDEDEDNIDIDMDDIQ